MRSLRGTGIKIGIFMAVMLMMTAALFAIFGQYRGGAENRYTASPSSQTSCRAATAPGRATAMAAAVASTSRRASTAEKRGWDLDRRLHASGVRGGAPAPPLAGPAPPPSARLTARRTRERDPAPTWRPNAKTVAGSPYRQGTPATTFSPTTDAAAAAAAAAVVVVVAWRQ